MSETASEYASILLKLARHAIAEALHQPSDLPDTSAFCLHQPGASFVTLTLHGQLRGCIGTLEAWRPLLEDVRSNAVAAAFRDPRFPPLQAAELAHIRIEVSLLTTPESLQANSEDALLRQLQPGRDGLILNDGDHRATFLPQVWEQLPEPQVFLAQLKCKAGLPADYWHEDLRFARYRVQKFSEPEP